jgi:hypothetical protein
MIVHEKDSDQHIHEEVAGNKYEEDCEGEVQQKAIVIDWTLTYILSTESLESIKE